MNLSKTDMFFNLLLSSRRVFHITTDYDLNERDTFKDNYFSSYGSGILIKLGLKYFLLTAKHVLKDYLDKELPNTSPFRITSHSSRNFDNTNHFLYPKRIWDIGGIIAKDENYDVEDVVLVELFQPFPWQCIDCCVVLEDVKILELSHFFKGLPVFDSGFSEVSNPYFYEGDNNTLPFDESKFTSSTKLERDVVVGKLNIEKDVFYFDKKNYLNVDTNGMSGGLIITIDDGEPKLLALHTRSSKKSNRINFIPFDKIYKSIVNYKESTYVNIDYLYYERMESRENLTSVADLFHSNLMSLGYDMSIYQEKNQEKFNLLFAEYLTNNEEFFVAISSDVDELNESHSSEFIMKELIAAARNYLIKLNE